jgi:DNA-binding beta-propeller fold protein YncE
MNGPEGTAIDAAAGRIYWGDYNPATSQVSVANLDGSGGGGALNTTGSTQAEEWGLAVAPALGRIYWAQSDGLGAVSFANLNGSGGGDLATNGATSASREGVAVDPPTNRIYFAEYTANKISFAKLDGTGGGGDLNPTGADVNAPSAVALDVGAGRIYWTNRGDSKISFARLDNTGGGGTLTIVGATVNDPIGIAIDPVAGKIYWANYGGNNVSFANLDGTSGGTLLTAGATTMGPTFPVLLRAPIAAGAPQVSWGSTTGSVLSCSPGAWAPDLLGSFLYRVPQSFAYQWNANGTDIPGATASSYTPTSPGSYGCRVTATNVAGRAMQTSAAFSVTQAVVLPKSTKATLSQIAESSAIFAVGASSTPLTGQTAARHPKGTTFSFLLDQPATVRITIQTKSRGRRVARTCRPSTPKLRHKPGCTRTISVATLTRTGHAGLNKVAFSGRVAGKALKVGRYQAIFTAINSVGASSPGTLGFRIVKR